MKSAMRGTLTSAAEVTNVSAHGFWLLLGEREIFAAFEDFPWFQDAAIRQLSHVEQPSANHLYWPGLDIDLALDSFEHSDRYPLMSKVRPDLGSPRTKRKLGRVRARTR